MPRSMFIYTFTHPFVALMFYFWTKRWRKETSAFSSMDDVIKHKAYKDIITLGRPVVPFIIAELRRGPEWWFYALTVITKQNPAATAPQGDIEAYAQAWLDWADRQPKM